jgi:hypothetical protein
MAKADLLAAFVDQATITQAMCANLINDCANDFTDGTTAAGIDGIGVKMSSSANVYHFQGSGTATSSLAIPDTGTEIATDSDFPVLANISDTTTQSAFIITNDAVTEQLAIRFTTNSITLYSLNSGGSTVPVDSSIEFLAILDIPQ